jgi:DNA-binding PadR family transcriptional regulator
MFQRSDAYANLTLEDMALLKQLKAAGDGGRTIRPYNMRLALARLPKNGYVVARPTGLDLVHYRITGRGQKALAEQD